MVVSSCPFTTSFSPFAHPVRMSVPHESRSKSFLICFAYRTSPFLSLSQLWYSSSLLLNSKAKGHSPVGPLLVQHTVTALSAANRLSTLQRNVLVAVTALVVYCARVDIDLLRCFRGVGTAVAAAVLLCRHSGWCFGRERSRGRQGGCAAVL